MSAPPQPPPLGDVSDLLATAASLAALNHPADAAADDDGTANENSFAAAAALAVEVQLQEGGDEPAIAVVECPSALEPSAVVSEIAISSLKAVSRTTTLVRE